MHDICRICGSGQIKYFQLPVKTYLTSDLKKWPNDLPPLFFECICGYIGKSFLEKLYKMNIHSTYSDYSPYSNSLGNEQIVFDKSEQKYMQRSDILLRHLLSYLKSPSKTNTMLEILEYGCGNGPFFSSLKKSNLGSWIVDGFDINDKFESYLQTEQKFRNFYKNEEEFLNFKYHLIVMSHVLEHLDNPSTVIQGLLKVLKQDGILFIQVPNSEVNYFDYLIADHLSHFTLLSLINLVKKVNCKVISKSEDIIPKEISIALSPGEYIHADFAPSYDNSISKDIVKFYESWRKLIDSMNANDRVVIFGTSIGSTWLFNELSNQNIEILGFLDEDVNKIGTSYKSKPVMDLKNFDLAVDTKMLIPLASTLVSIIFRKYKDRFPEAQGVNNEGIYKIKDIF